ncbi:MAG TPA: glycosyl hydrolase family 18 protein, partial [Mucilaginibacter sp.]|nr:glycosyl hydrolase family 18 protein [Mucilaginibacter sp.]
SFSDKALAQLDFINVMSYDKTGPWNQAKPGQHSPYSMAVDDMNYWGGARGIAKEKLSLGVPFYGYGFGVNAPGSLAFSEILVAYPGSESLDQVTVAGGGIVYYNGIPTIKNKTEVALNKAGGIMIWQLRQDAKGANSLLNAINTVIKAHSK